MLLALAACSLMLVLAALIAFTAGAKSALLSPPLWWVLAGSMYTILPVASGAVTRSNQPVVIVMVTEESIANYLLFVGVTTLAFSVGWRVAYGPIPSGGYPLFSQRVLVSTHRLFVLVALGIALKITSGILSGVDPQAFLATVSDYGYSFTGIGSYRFSMLGHIAQPVMAVGASLLVYNARGAESTQIKVWSMFAAGVVLIILVLMGVRAHVILFLASSALLLVIHPKGLGATLAKRVLVSTVAITCAVLLYPVALWMQESRSTPGQEQLNAIQFQELGPFFDLVTPSAALFDWVRSWGLVPGLSVADAVVQAPPTLLVPNSPRPEFLNIVDSLNVANSGAAVTTPAELYANAGWVFGPLVIFGVGAFTAWLQKRVLSRSRAWNLVVAASLGPSFAQIFTRGYLWQSITTVLLVFIGAWAVSLVAEPRLVREARQNPNINESVSTRKSSRQWIRA